MSSACLLLPSFILPVLAPMSGTENLLLYRSTALIRWRTEQSS